MASPIQRFRIPRPRAGQRPRPDYQRKFRRTLYAHMAWPIAAVATLFALGFLLMPPTMTGLWTGGALMAAAGAFLSVPMAIVLGVSGCLSLLPVLLDLQAQGQANSLLYTAFALLPLCPLCLAVARCYQARATRLHILLQLPQVQAAMDVSDWSLMPTPRALDRRIRQHLAEHHITGRKETALVYYIAFRALEQSRELLGMSTMQKAVLDLANGLRQTLRNGDMIGEDMRGHGHLYILAFPNPEFNDNETAIADRVRPLLENSQIGMWHMAVARIPEDGSQLQRLHWHPLS